MKGGIIDNATIMDVKNVKVDFQVGQETVHALKSASFKIQANSFNIIYGPSGSGKSTLLNVLGGLQRPTEGTVTVQDRNIYQLPSEELANFRANRVGFIHQTNYWVKSLNVIDNLAIPLYALGFSRAKAEKLVLGSLDRVGMRAYAKKYPAILSGGEQQRVAMARALANEPIVIIADEPTGNLDTNNGDSIMELLLNCQAEFRRTIVLVTHNMEYISFADHLLSIQDGVVEDIDRKDTSGITNTLIKNTKRRINDLAEVKAHAFKD